MKHRGTVLLSVLSFVLIFSAFETYRYLNYVQRQQVYQALISDYQQPAMKSVRLSQSSQSKVKPASTHPKHAATYHRGFQLELVSENR